MQNSFSFPEDGSQFIIVRSIKRYKGNSTVVAIVDLSIGDVHVDGFTLRYWKGDLWLFPPEARFIREGRTLTKQVVNVSPQLFKLVQQKVIRAFLKGK